MKRFLALILVLCMCTAALSSCTSCDSGGDGEVETPSAPTEPKKYADPKLIKRLQTYSCSTRKEVKELFGVEPINYDDKYDKADVYMFDDGRAVYIEYYHNESQGIMNTKVEEMIDTTLLDQIKEGYSYDKITEIFGGIKGTMTTSMYWGLYRYVLNDGRLLYINYDQCAFATGMRITSADGKTETLGAPAQKAKEFDDFDLFKQHLIENYKENIVIPKLLSSEYKFGKGIDSRECFSYSFGPASYGLEDKEFYEGLFTVKVYKIGILYEDMVDFYKTKENEEVIECREGVSFVKEWGRFLFNNNGRVITVDIPTTLREDMPWNRDENSPPAITTLEELEKYLVIDYLDLPGAEE